MTLDTTERSAVTHVASGGVKRLPGSHCQRDPHSRPAFGDRSAAQRPVDTQKSDGGARLTPGHDVRDPRILAAGGVLPATHRPYDRHIPNGGGNTLPAASSDSDPTEETPLATPVNQQQDALLLILADALDGLERVRIATDNRLRSLTATPTVAHDSAKGFRMDSREARTMTEIATTLCALEHRAELDLRRHVRAHPLWACVKNVPGVGDKQFGRLLAAIGDPYIRPAQLDEAGNITAPARPRLLSELRQYCGHGAPSKRQRGVKSWWNPTAKMRLHLIAESVVKQRCEPCTVHGKARDDNKWVGPPRDCTCPVSHPYRAVFDSERGNWDERDTSDGHKKNHALRMVGKRLLEDLWTAARDLHEEKTT